MHATWPFPSLTLLYLIILIDLSGVRYRLWGHQFRNFLHANDTSSLQQKGKDKIHVLNCLGITPWRRLEEWVYKSTYSSSRH
jgi:hypothetical protein